MMNRFFNFSWLCLTAVGQHEVDNVCCVIRTTLMSWIALIQTVLTAGLMTTDCWTITVHNVRMKQRAII